MGKCKVCGSPHSVCGPSGAESAVTVLEAHEGSQPMALKRYRVTVHNRRSSVETIMKLTPEQAERIGATEYVKSKEKAAPANKQRSAPANKSRSAKSKEKAAPANKQRSAPEAAAEQSEGE